MLRHTIEVRLKLKFEEFDVEHELVLAITLELFEALSDLIEGYKDVFARALLLDQDISADSLTLVLSSRLLILLISVYSDEGVLTSDQAAYLVLGVIVQNEVVFLIASTDNIANNLVIMSDG